MQPGKAARTTSAPVDRLKARNAALPALFTYGFRPFFLGATTMAAVAVPAWLFDLGQSGLPQVRADW